MNGYSLRLLADAHRADLLRAAASYRPLARRRAPSPLRIAVPRLRVATHRAAPCPTC